MYLYKYIFILVTTQPSLGLKRFEHYKNKVIKAIKIILKYIFLEDVNTIFKLLFLSPIISRAHSLWGSMKQVSY